MPFFSQFCFFFEGSVFNKSTITVLSCTILFLVIATSLRLFSLTFRLYAALMRRRTTSTPVIPILTTRSPKSSTFRFDQLPLVAAATWPTLTKSWKPPSGCSACLPTEEYDSRWSNFFFVCFTHEKNIVGELQWYWFYIYIYIIYGLYLSTVENVFFTVLLMWTSNIGTKCPCGSEKS